MTPSPIDRGFKRVFRLDRSSGDDKSRAVDDELRHHIELAAEELVDTGWERTEAHREALRQFGDVDETRAYCEQMQARRGRDERRRDMMSFDEIRQDVTYALRSIRKAPGYAGLVILTLAFGIAANTTIFSVMNPYLFRPLPFGDADALVQVNVVNPVTGWDMDRFSYPQYADWQERSRAFTDLAAYTYGSANVTDAEGPEQIQYSRLTPNMFDVLDAQPELGRTFRPEEGGPAGERVVVMAHGVWQRRYAADPSIVGRAITLDGVQHTVRFHTPHQGKLYMSIDGRAAEYLDLIRLDGALEQTGGGGRVTAPMHGLLLEVRVAPGDEVAAGQTLAVLEAMKMHYEIVAEAAGTVSEVLVAPGVQVAADDVLIEIEVAEMA